MPFWKLHHTLYIVGFLYFISGCPLHLSLSSVPDNCSAQVAHVLHDTLVRSSSTIFHNSCPFIIFVRYSGLPRTCLCILSSHICCTQILVLIAVLPASCCHFFALCFGKCSFFFSLTDAPTCFSFFICALVLGVVRLVLRGRDVVPDFRNVCVFGLRNEDFRDRPSFHNGGCTLFSHWCFQF